MQLEKSVKVYNFEVEDWHTYFVSQCSVLVHNSCTADGVGNAYANLAEQATNNTASGEVVLGKFNQNGISYVDVAKNRGSTYFELNNWDEVSSRIGNKNMWNINENFLD